MRFDEYISHDGLGLAELIRRGHIQPSELLELAIARTDATHPQINAVIRRLDASARATASRQARDAQLGQPRGPFAGVPFLVKDFMQGIASVPSASGSRALQALSSGETADVTRRWLGQGLLIFGMTSTPEFAAKGVTEPWAYGPCRNPWDLTRTPGGSSGGSAAAVAAGIVPMAGANDGGGSIRIPAAACGLFGLKVGRGRISMGPQHSEGMFGAAVQGVLSRSVRDSAAMLDILQGPEPHAPYHMPAPASSHLANIARAPRPLRIGFSSQSPLGTPVHPDAHAAVQDAAELLQSLGHHVEPAQPGVDGVQLAEDFLDTWFCMIASMVHEARTQHGARWSDFEPDTRALAAAGQSMSAIELLRAHDNWQTHVRALARFHAQYDLWLSPTLASAALPIGALRTPSWLSVVSDLTRVLGLAGVSRKASVFRERMRDNLSWTPFTQLANLTGRPAMSVPLYWNAQGLPLGVQFVAPPDGEGLLLQLAAQLEQARPWFDRRPALPALPAH